MYIFIFNKVNIMLNKSWPENSFLAFIKNMVNGLKFMMGAECLRQ